MKCKLLAVVLGNCKHNSLQPNLRIYVKPNMDMKASYIGHEQLAKGIGAHVPIIRAPVPLLVFLLLSMLYHGFRSLVIFRAQRGIYNLRTNRLN